MTERTPHPAIVALARVIHEASRSEFGYSARHPSPEVREKAAKFWETYPARHPEDFAVLIMEAEAAYRHILGEPPSANVVDAVSHALGNDGPIWPSEDTLNHWRGMSFNCSSEPRPPARDRTGGKMTEDERTELWLGVKHRILDELRISRRRKKLTYLEIAKRLGRHKMTVWKQLTGRDNISVETMNSLASAMGMRLVLRLEDDHG